jgi:hypothetical protein
VPRVYADEDRSIVRHIVGSTFCTRSRVCRVEVVVLIAIRCAGCASIFYVCPSDYRGHIYCQQRCRSVAARASKARHQRSRIGRRNHASHNATYREKRHANGVPLQKVRDTPTEKLSDGSFSCVRELAAPCTEQGRARVPRSTEYAHHKTPSHAHTDDNVRCIVCGCTGSFIHPANEAPLRAFRRVREARKGARVRHIVV